VLANVSKGAARTLEYMRMDDYWDVFDSVEAARDAFGRAGDRPRPRDPS
jgi:hypothetical protein